jgi:phosphoribosylaminoimidazole-succinocarboxamide synthase
MQLNIPEAHKTYIGKVRNVYYFGNNIIALEASNRISAFDCILPKPIPYKGQVLHQLAAFMLKKTSHICKNWLWENIPPNIGIGQACEPIKIEVVVRGYLAGHANRQYQKGIKTICGITLPNGLKENQKLPEPILTPTTKAAEGHDEDISEEEILNQKLINPKDWEKLKTIATALYNFGANYANTKGLILVDTKYEFGYYNGEIILMDEIHTPDSSRYFYLEGYEAKLKNNEKQIQLSKEFVREWLIENDFMGLPGQTIPTMTPEIVADISNKYIYLYEKLTSETFIKLEIDESLQTQQISNFINNHSK